MLLAEFCVQRNPNLHHRQVLVASLKVCFTVWTLLDADARVYKINAANTVERCKLRQLQESKQVRDSDIFIL